MRGLRLLRKHFRFRTSRFQASMRIIVLGIFRALADFVVRLRLGSQILTTTVRLLTEKVKERFFMSSGVLEALAIKRQASLSFPG